MSDVNPKYRVVGADQREYGPADAHELRWWIAEGRVNLQTLAQAEGSSDWRPLGAYPEFASTFAPAPAPFPSQPAAGGLPTHTNGMAVTGFVCGLVSLFSFLCCCCFGPVPSILGLIFSWVGLSQTNRDSTQGGRGLAIAGIVMSLLGLVVSCGGFLLWLVAVMAQGH